MDHITEAFYNVMYQYIEMEEAMRLLEQERIAG